MSDRYDQEVERLTKEPERIFGAWFSASPLFGFVTPSRLCDVRDDSKSCGCLTLVMGEVYVAWTDELTAAIRADERLPKDSSGIGPANLPVFAEWQRKIDAALGRTPPPLLEAT